MPVSVVLIALNEEKNIGDCLKCLGWADEIVVIDGGSTDATVEIAKKYTDKIFFHPFENFGDQKNFAIGQAVKDWVFIIDADERVTEPLAREILSITERPDHDAVYAVKRNTYLFGKLFRYTGTQDDYPLRLFPRIAACFRQPVHEVLETNLPVKRLKNTLIHYSTGSIDQYFSKFNHYQQLELRFMRESGRRVYIYDLLLRPVARFLYLYLWKKGILDGWEGLQFSMLSSYYDYVKVRNYIFTGIEKK